MRRMRLAAAALFFLTSTVAALAHAKMTESTPADGASVAGAVSEIQLKFSHPMRLTLVKVHRDDDDADLSLKSPLPKAFTSSAKLDVEPLGAGAYEVRWTAVSEDGHVMKGHFGFTVNAGSPAPSP